jgi:hypothetical protein
MQFNRRAITGRDTFSLDDPAGEVSAVADFYNVVVWLD